MSEISDIARLRSSPGHREQRRRVSRDGAEAGGGLRTPPRRWALWATCLVVAVMPTAVAAAGGAGPSGTPPAKVANAVKETDLNTITLTPKAEERLGIQVAAVERKKVPATRLLGGELMVPVGHSITVSAPLAGRVQSTEFPAAGHQVRKGQPLLVFLPVLLLSPSERVQLQESRIAAAGELAEAQAQAEAAGITLERARELLRSGTGSQRAVDEAQAAKSVAEARLNAAKSRVEMLSSVHESDPDANAAPFQMQAPIEGILTDVRVTAGQWVASGTPLFRVVHCERLWVRVPVPVSELPQLNTGAEAQVGPVQGGASPGTIPARPVVAPPTANPDAATADLYYEIENRDTALRPGQRVGVVLARRGETEALVVPWAAVLHDIHGGQWVYEKTQPQTYVRRRVLVARLSGSDAVLAAGPKPGTPVVTDGAAELFGTEFGVGK